MPRVAQIFVVTSGTGESEGVVASTGILNDFYQRLLIRTEIFGIDADAEFLENAKKAYPEAASNFIVGTVDNLPYDDKSFDHILCCAVLHFANSETHFTAMFREMVRVLKPNGTLLIRMASNIGLDGNAPEITYKENGQKGTYYLTRERITSLTKEYNLELIEPVKTTNVQDMRAMTTLVLQKN